MPGMRPISSAGPALHHPNPTLPPRSAVRQFRSPQARQLPRLWLSDRLFVLSYLWKKNK